MVIPALEYIWIKSWRKGLVLNNGVKGRSGAFSLSGLHNPLPSSDSVHHNRAVFDLHWEQRPLINNTNEWGQQGAVPSINWGFLCKIQKKFQPPKHCMHLTFQIIKFKVRQRQTPIFLGQRQGFQTEVRFLPMPDEFWNSFINIRKNYLFYLL